jgi:UDP-N-acetylglucosamine 2-epimerase
LINVEKIEDLEKTILATLNNLAVNKSEIEEIIDEFHPYSDGKSSERTVNAVEDMLSGNNLPEKNKPKNILRNYRLRRDLNYWKF